MFDFCVDFNQAKCTRGENRYVLKQHRYLQLLAITGVIVSPCNQWANSVTD